MKIDLVETSDRTIAMMANFLHRQPAELQLADNLRKKWKMTAKDFEILEIWIEGPISASVRGYFQDVGADVSVAELQDEDVVSTIDTLVDLIWDNIPEENKTK